MEIGDSVKIAENVKIFGGKTGEIRAINGDEIGVAIPGHQYVLFFLEKEFEKRTNRKARVK